MRLILQSFKANLSQQEIIDMIDPVELAAIKEEDPHPYFQAFSICHEGESKPKVLNGQTKPIKWFRAAVQSLKKLALKGINFFCGHNDDNSTNDRKSLGRVVANKEMEIDGKLNHIAIAYHAPDVREEAKKYDICSMEAFWDLVDKGKEYVANAAEKITGIALGNSDNELPAFPGAKRLGMVQAFETPAEGEQGADSGSPRRKEERMTLQEVKRFIEEHGTPVWYLYNKEQIAEDKYVQKLITENETLKGQVEEKDGTIETLQTEKESAIKAEKLSTVDKRLNEILSDPEKKYTEVNKKFVLKRFGRDKSKLTDEQLTDDGLQEFITTAIDDYKFTISLDGNQEPETPPAPNDKTDFTKAENNELLNEDLD